MKIILGPRGLAALGWLSFFAYLWLFVFGLVPGGWAAVGILLISFIIGLVAGHVAEQLDANDRQSFIVAAGLAAGQKTKLNPPAMTSKPDKPEPQEH